MGSSRRFTPLAYNSIAALAGAAIMLGLVRAHVAEVDRTGVTAPPSIDASPSQSPSEPRGVAETDLGAPEDTGPTAPSPSASATADAEPASSWTTETQPEAPEAAAPAPLSGWTVLPSLQRPWQGGKPNPRKPIYSLKSRLAELSPEANPRIAGRFAAAKVAWPPSEIALIAIKDQKLIELQARSGGGAWSLVHRYRVLAASGGTGPKLQQGDRQVPEGIYNISYLNPNSAYHVSLRVNYPNAFDRQMAAVDGRSALGGDIMIHGKNVSAGCLAIGDEAVEELFVLAAQMGLANVRVIIAPTDLREVPVPAPIPGQPAWTPQLYAEIATALAPFKAPANPGLLSYFLR